MGQITVDVNLCKKDGACVAVCPPGILRLNDEKFPEEIPGGDCMLCGHCVAVCTCNAITHSGLPQEGFLPASKELPNPAAMDGFLMSRRSVREFKNKPVSRDILESLLNVARRAPTAKNSQTLHWIATDDREKIHALSAETINYLRDAGIPQTRLAQWDSGYDFVLRGAPVLIVTCTPADYSWGTQDCAIALTYLELAAEARGLGVCWAGYLAHVAGVHAPLREKLSVPDGYVVHGGLMLGERKYSYPLIPPRKPLSVEWI
ncbi:MAG TPA: nitroreductase family protein [Candidatus Saccharimonadales bacterium]|nr:nitroreductase family protein [Candidatus Saccharimonadales bacterium]